ncbi:MAG TPA: glycoside hydrolase family 27 protein [Bacteroidales bacterium]|nr:glycoside hydrolase family 27 protein [Bacteroidales bacterium]HPO65789.1 glycoside hydrolase family 27 protein [Bacteroidales bacterium]
MKRIFLMLILAGLPFGLYSQKYAELAKTPPMGWNSWNRFGCNINEQIIREMADAMVASGMREVGYTYINIDDCWQGGRDSLGFLYPDPQRFPSGIKALADYVHSKGLKLGIYSDAGWKTCGGYPGSRGYEFQDALQFAEWGIDYLKYDWCNTDNLVAEEAYKTMAHALMAAGRPIVFSICEWGNNKPWLWGAKYGHLWRTTGDIVDCWNCELGHGSWVSNGILRILDMQMDKNLNLRQYAGPGHWNDPDMMEVGNRLSVNESRAHFSLWCMLAAPLIAGNDLRNMTKEIQEILTNKEMIDINQDTLGVQCFRWFDYGDVQIFAKPLANGHLAVCFLNRGDTPQPISFDWKDSENIYDGKYVYEFNKVTYKLRDVWGHKDVGNTSRPFVSTIPARDVIVLRLIPLQ